MSSYDLDDLRSELDDYAKPKKTASRTPREERIIAGFEDILRFVDEHHREPQHGETHDIFERLYAVRLDRLRASAECSDLLKDMDPKGLLTSAFSVAQENRVLLDDDALLAELDMDFRDTDISRLTHVKPRQERNAAEEIAQRVVCEDFKKFRPLFLTIQSELHSGLRATVNCKDKAEIQVGQFFILFGQKAYIAEVGEIFSNNHDRKDARLRVIFDNGTQSNMLMTSLQRALYKDDASRRITEPNLGPLFSGEKESQDTESGVIYVLRSKSGHPDIQKNQHILHKIGVTSGSVEKRIADAKNDPTFLLADVEVVATYKLSNINRVKLENIIHKFFEHARLDIEIKDRFGKLVVPREWYLVPLFVIDEAVDRIKSGAILTSQYDVSLGKIIDLE